MISAPDPTIVFGGFELHPARRLLLRAGVVVPVPPKAYDLLTLLISERPCVVSKTELHERLWPGTYVSDASLASIVTQLRSALGDTRERAEFIRTAHGFGYAFVGEVTSKATDAVRRTTRRSWLLWGKRRVPLTAGEHIVGREPDASIWIDAPSVSRRHARLTVGASAVSLEDLGSKNGTFRGDERLARIAVLKDGDQLKFGSIRMHFRSTDNASSTKTSD